MAQFDGSDNRVACDVFTYNDMGHLMLDVRWRVDAADLTRLQSQWRCDDWRRTQNMDADVSDAVYAEVGNLFTTFTKGSGTTFYKAKVSSLRKTLQTRGFSVDICIHPHNDYCSDTPGAVQRATSARCRRWMTCAPRPSFCNTDAPTQPPKKTCAPE
jgi:hypothetical protein